MINLVFLLDITGSMADELAGVKKTVRHLVDSVFEEEYAVMITIITFTESSQGCFVTSNSFTEGEEATNFVKSIKLCVPPGQPGVCANGGDGDENQKAALAELLTLDSTMPSIAFLITDAGPHLLAETRTREAEHEINFLKEKHSIVDSDMFNVLALVQAHFEGNLIVNIVKYVKNSDHRMYGSIAKKFDGVLIEPKVRNAQQLASGLMVILSKMFDRCAGGTFTTETEDTVSEAALDTFIFYDLEDFSIPSCEDDVKKNSIPKAGDTRDVLFGFLDRATVVVGDRFAKRAIAASGLREQVELLITIAQCLTGKLGYNDALDRATTLVEAIRDLMPEENKSHLKLTAESLPAVLQQKIDTSSELEASVSAITLLTTQEATEDALEEEDVFDPRTVLQTVASLFLAHLAVLQLPEKNGKPDFMDAWSAVITKISPDVVTARDFLTLIGSDEATGGLSIRARDYNYAQLVADPDDALGSALVKAASGTQVLDILTGLLSGAPAGLFCPNMFRGTISASLMSLLEQRDEPLSDFQWELVAKFVHSIRLIMGGSERLPTMPVDPEAAMGKLLFRLLRRSEGKYDSEALVAVLKELLATRVRKFSRFNEARYLELVERMVGYTHESVVEDAFDPHELDQDVWKFTPEKAQNFAAQTPFFRAFEQCANNLIRSVTVTPKKYGDATQVVPTLQELWPTCTQELPKYLLLQKRSARYRIVRDVGAADGKINWEMNGVMDEYLGGMMYAELAMQVLRKKYDAFLRELRERRANEAAEQRWSRALKTARVSSMDEFLAQLALIRDSASREHKLLWKALKQLGSSEKQPEHYEDKMEVLITGRTKTAQGDYEVVFNRGNLHPHPNKLAPMSAGFQAKLRELRRKYNWPVHHTYRAGKANHNGHSNEKPSEWAKKRSMAEKTFWEEA
ncbi:Voltage-dependent P/Q-type calcium channel subunit alpha-1A [Phytophthora cinnamomi]|uniref:Voltage-dependent P/Q-type calcium channel subunit alpha-1A n=1 Tax=Phytophthora cinnamomi TaxID=4785 RepID=UPI0035593E6F|nr:Voltage-dependent P/Q-type calcium channel subunit alpha-1A [Phytophthora cinnamomi]